MAGNQDRKPTPRKREKASRRTSVPGGTGASVRGAKPAGRTAGKGTSSRGLGKTGLGADGKAAAGGRGLFSKLGGGAKGEARPGGGRPSFLDGRVGSQPQSGREARRARARRLKAGDILGTVARVAVLVVLLAAICFAGYLVLANTSAFKISNVEVEGSEHVSAEDITKLATVPEGSTLLNIDTEALTQSLRKNPWVESVNITRDFPSTLKIGVTERKVVAVVVMSSRSVAWYLGQGNVWIEPAQIKVKEGQSTDDAALKLASSIGAILITGVPSTVNPVPGSVATDEVIAAVDQYRDGFTEKFSSQIVSFQAGGTDSISCVLSNGVEVSLGAPVDIAAKQAVIEELLSKYPGQLTYINVRVPSNPSYRKIDSENATPGTGALGAPSTEEPAARPAA